jgi:predicted ATPase/DNA-binding SARP family transcriptional activator/tetratricopeptide (TPR) repeat protein
VQVAILGPLEVYDADGNPIEVTGARLRTLLMRLALDAGRPVPPGALVDAVWGDRPPADEANALQTLVSRLRRALGNAATVGQSPAGYRLGVEPDDVDAHRFERLWLDGSAALRDGAPAHASELLHAALALWRGPIEADAGDAVRAAAVRLDELRVAAVVDRVTADVALGNGASAVPELEALTALLPLDERVAAAHVTALAHAGRQADALRAYERIRARLADELGVDPSTELQGAHLAVLRGEVDRIAADDAVPRTNLKAQLTSFVGRDEEIARVGKALQENRLVTLVGPGGAGKTRLACEAGAKLLTRDGVWLAELAPISDGADIAQTVLGALGLREKHLLDRRSSRVALDAEARLVDVLSDKAPVLVLDNCEHVIDASARLAEHLLGQCPDLRVLATSREPLGIIGEVVLAVPPLGQPVADAPSAIALEYPAVRLFADRAAAAQPDFSVDDTTVATVIDIVRRLDGLPLAIELAAARLRTLPLAEIAARLSDRFRLLTGGSRTALPRHRTLRAVVEWSWDLLGAAERLLVERLAVFPAGVTVDSAIAVGADEQVPAADVPDLLVALVDKSLLHRVGDGVRLRMLETIREYGVERLGERGELEAVRRRHADHFALLLTTAEPYLTSGNQLPWFDLLTDERENIVAALRFRCDTGDADGALTVAIGLGGFAMMLGNHGDISAWMREALAVPGGTDDDLRWIARAMFAMNAVAGGSDSGEVDGGLAELREVATSLRRVSVEGHPMLGILRPAVAFFAGDEALSAQMIEESLGSDDPWLSAAARMFRANIAENAGDIESMRADIDDAIGEFRRLGERWGLANTLRGQGLIHTLDGELEQAEAAYAEAFDLMSQLRSHEDEAFLLVRLADIALRRGDTDRARALIHDAAETAEQTGSTIEAVFTMSMIAEIERQAGDLETARSLHRQAMTRVNALPTGHAAQQHARTIVLVLSARLAFGDGEREQALVLACDAYQAAVATHDLPITAMVGVVIADMAAQNGSAEAAAGILGAAARLRGADDLTSADISRQIAELRAVLGERFDVLYEEGKSLDRDAALKRLDPAEALQGR